MKNPLFPELPSNLEELSDTELQELLAERRSIVRRIDQKDPELVEGRTQAEILDELTAGVEQIELITADMEIRGQADTEFETAAKSLVERAGVVGEPEIAEAEAVAEAEAQAAAEEAAEPVAETAEAEVVAEAPAETVAETVEEPVAVVASVQSRRPLPKASKAHKPAEPSDGRFSLVAAAGIPGFEGKELSEHDLAMAMIAKRYQGSSMPPGFTDKALVASVDYMSAFDESRILRGDSSDMEKVRNVTDMDAIVASGGLCAPPANYYDLMNVSVADRPVRDGLAGFAATRGGLRFAGVPTLADVPTTGADAAVGIKTEAQDAAGGTTATKTCYVVDCPEFEEVLLSMIYRCVQFGNLNARAWPEQVAQFNELVLAAHARLAETALLDGIASFSTQVTQDPIYGATSSIINAILFAVAGMRSRHRMAPNARFRAIFPAWTRDLIIADLVNQQFDRFSRDEAGVQAFLGQYGVNVSWTLDGPTAGGQVFGAQSDGVLLDFPGTVKWFLFPEGSFLFLDGGTLDLGIVRDSTLNSTNDFQIFAETFENVAYVGVESLEITSTVCPSGAVAAPSTAICHTS